MGLEWSHHDRMDWKNWVKDEWICWPFVSIFSYQRSVTGARYTRGSKLVSFSIILEVPKSTTSSTQFFCLIFWPHSFPFNTQYSMQVQHPKKEIRFYCVKLFFTVAGKNEVFLDFKGLTLSWRRQLSYRNQSIDLQSKPMDWLLYDNGLRHDRVN